MGKPTPEDIDRVLARINEADCAELALGLGQIYSPHGREGEAAQFVEDWLIGNDMSARRIAFVPDRPNILSTVQGDRRRPSMIFNAHMDHARAKDEIWSLRDPTNPVLTQAWAEGNEIHGHGVVNDKGPLAATMIAARALKESGVELAGDVLVSAVVGEIDMDPVDEFEAPEYVGHHVGTQYLVTHGGVADYALNAEASGFSIIEMEAGVSYFKVTIFGGPARYVPFTPLRGEPTESNNAIVRASSLVQQFEEWAAGYQERNRYESTRGTCLPKALIAAIRSGYPYKLVSNPELCSLYLNVMLPPSTTPAAVHRELRDLLDNGGHEGTVELISWQPGYEVGSTADGLIGGIREAHALVRGGEPARPGIEETSMWRDMNVFNNFGIPSVCYGPGGAVGRGRWFLTAEELADAARVYALTALFLE